MNGFEDVYEEWVDLGIDGFRIDTVKHVNFEFWQKFSPAVLAERRQRGNHDFFMFGEVYDADPAYMSRTTDGELKATLDFTFQPRRSSSPKASPPRGCGTVRRRRHVHRHRLQRLGAADVPRQPRHGPHRLLLLGSGRRQAAAAVELAHELMYLTRGQPVVYYGDEQGFAGAGGRQGRPAGPVRHPGRRSTRTRRPVSARRRRVDGPLRHRLRRSTSTSRSCRAARASNPALADGAQIEPVRRAAPALRVLRVDPTEKIEYLVAANNATRPAVGHLRHPHARRHVRAAVRDRRPL